VFVFFFRIPRFHILRIMLVVDVHGFNASLSFAFVNSHSVKKCLFVDCEFLVFKIRHC